MSILAPARVLSGTLLLASVLGAPLQCARRATADQRLEDDPAEVLYALAEKFKVEGNAPARAETLRFLVARYPESRFTTAARLDLAEPARVTPEPP